MLATRKKIVCSIESVNSLTPSLYTTESLQNHIYASFSTAQEYRTARSAVGENTIALPHNNIIIKHLSELSTWVFTYICVCVCAIDFCLKWKMMMMMISVSFCRFTCLDIFVLVCVCSCLIWTIFLPVCLCVCACVCSVVVLFYLVLFYGLLPDSNKDWLIDW